MSAAALLAILTLWAAAAPVAHAAENDAGGHAPDGYLEPAPPIVDLLTAMPPPETLVHSRSRQVALVFRPAVMPMAWLTRPRLGLAGYRLDPVNGTIESDPLVERVEVVDATGERPHGVVWQPGPDAWLEYVRFSPDGRRLSALRVRIGEPSRLALFDIATGVERVLDVPVRAAWGDPCAWAGAETLVCRVEPSGERAALDARPTPLIITHEGKGTPVRTYSNLLESDFEDRQFEFYFEAELARVGIDGEVARVPASVGLLHEFDPSPDASRAVVRRLTRPYSRLVKAARFPSVVEVWDLVEGRRLYASTPSGFGVEEADEAASEPRRIAWRSDQPVTAGFVQRRVDGDGARIHEWISVSEPYGRPVVVATSKRPLQFFDWTSAGTPLYVTGSPSRVDVEVWAVLDGGPRQIWRGDTRDHYRSPGRALRVDGETGPVLESGGRIFLAGDGLSDRGPRPFLHALDLREGTVTELFTSEDGVFEEIVAVTEPAVPTLVTSRETTTEPPNLFRVSGEERTALRPLANPYPQLDAVERRFVTYARADGVPLSGTLYRPADRPEGERLPTLVWIYPYEFSDVEHAAQLDVRQFRFHRVVGPSPLAAVLAGYAVLVNPTVPIIHEGSAVNDRYLEQLVQSAEAAVDHLVEIGVTDPERVAIGGRSYGAFSSANLLIHSDRFATAIAMSGAYNRTLTPFGFQREKRSFWEATPLYTAISPFFHANEIEVPILLVHGADDPNPGTPPLQARRFFHALAGEGVTARYVELPYEEHHYRGRPGVLHATREMIDWLDATIGPKAGAAAGDQPPAAD